MYLFFKDIKSLRRESVIELPLKEAFNKALLTYVACMEKLGSGVAARINWFINIHSQKINGKN
jgi:hypothetical protein